MSVSKLVAMSNKYGADKDFVLAGGGNTSYKTDDVIYIKGSGTSLATITPDGFVEMRRDKLAAMWNKKYTEDEKTQEAEVLEDMMNARVTGSGNKRPSVETLLHDLFKQQFVLHVHPSIVNGVTCSNECEQTVKALFGESAVYVPATKPGYNLAVFCKAAINKYKNETNREPNLLILQNHGIFFAADDVETIDKLVEKSIALIKSKVKRFEDFAECEYNKESVSGLSPVLRMIYRNKTQSDTAIVKFVINNEIKKMCENKEAYNPLIKSFSPDHIVYYKAETLFIESGKDIKSSIDNFIAEKKYIPKAIVLEKLGCFIFGNTKKEADTAAELFLDAVRIAVYSESFGGYSPLSKELTDFIVNWEVESYRQKVAISFAEGNLSSSNLKKLDEKIVIITGAAQGFGKGIAESALKAGANVVIADMNYEGAAAVAEELNEQSGVKNAFAVNVNVTDEESVKEMMNRTVAEFGGVDIFINNAGIVKAGGLDEMQKKDFDLVTAVNYTAYFLCVKYASKIMKLQTSEESSYMCDIIEINSKSGLAGSNKNFAYAGSKFGGIGLTQSFALELAPYNIKVNAICPGNFLSGSLWSDPENGLFVQYLNSGKVPGAKTAEDVKKFYESKVPMGRGCEIEDVMKAVLYVIDQRYETGQAFPVTGGQEMLK